MMWKPIKGYEDRYEVSDIGEVFSLRSNRLIRPIKINSGYLSYRLTVKGKTKHQLAHRLVAEHFLQNPDGKRTVNHKDGNKLNNHVSNLEWMTHSEQHLHAFQNGRENPTAFELGVNKLSADNVRYIRNNLKHRDKEFGICPLARKFGVSPECIRKVYQRKSYKSVV